MVKISSNKPKGIKPSGGGTGKRQSKVYSVARKSAMVSNQGSKTLSAGQAELMSLPTSSVAMYAQCMASPEDCPPCRVPDEYVSPTSAIKLTREFTIPSDPAGTAVFTVTPALSNNVGTYSVTAGAISSAAADVHPDLSSLTASFAIGRAVATEIIVTYIGAPLNAAGRLVAVEEGTGGVMAGNVLSAMMDDGDSDAAINGRRVIVRPTQAPRFETIAGNSQWMLGTFATWHFVALGLPVSTTVFSVRIVTHFEGIPLKSSIMRGNAVPEPANPESLTIAANISQVHKSGPADNKQQMKKAVLHAATVAWRALGPQVSRAMMTGGAAAMASSRAALLALM